MGERTVISTNIAGITGSPYRGKKRQKNQFEVDWRSKTKNKH